MFVSPCLSEYSMNVHLRSSRAPTFGVRAVRANARTKVRQSFKNNKGATASHRPLHGGNRQLVHINLETFLSAPEKMR
jgi:hypothetical protein